MADSRWVVFGANGMLGNDFIALLLERDRQVLALSREAADITRLEDIRVQMRPGDIVVNCAAYTRVDDAESNRDIAFAINAEGAANLAQACAELGARLVHVSTDYVFGDAPAGRPLAVDAVLTPRCVYGESKAAGETAVHAMLGETALIARVAWLYGAHGHNFVRTVRSRLAAGQPMRVVNDQWGQPTWTRDAASTVIDLVDAGATGTHHVTNSGAATWFEFARAIAAVSGFDPELITPIPSSEYPTPAQRPRWSVLETEPSMRDWRDALRQFINGDE